YDGPGNDCGSSAAISAVGGCGRPRGSEPVDRPVVEIGCRTGRTLIEARLVGRVMLEASGEVVEALAGQPEEQDDQSHDQDDRGPALQRCHGKHGEGPFDGVDVENTPGRSPAASDPDSRPGPTLMREGTTADPGLRARRGAGTAPGLGEGAPEAGPLVVVDAHHARLLAARAQLPLQPGHGRFTPPWRRCARS